MVPPAVIICYPPKINERGGEGKLIGEGRWGEIDREGSLLVTADGASQRAEV